LAHQFSCVRKTHAELLEKIRYSGCYDDKKYDFEDWIRDVLRNIEPGYAGRSSLGVDIFKGYAVWKDVIHTSSQLLMEIPDELGRYLGD
jgi:hypothetical protein